LPFAVAARRLPTPPGAIFSHWTSCTRAFLECSYRPRD
jgi:hypothetical protein